MKVARGPISTLVIGPALTLALVALTSNAVRAQRGGLTGAERLAVVYDAILDARFDQVPALVSRACGPGTPDGAPPAEACRLMEVVSLWWEIQIDSNDTSRDRLFQTRADDAIAAIEAWTAREPQRAEAWFYLGGAYGARAQWRVLRRELIAAARDGKRIKGALERALELDPTLQDAYFGIGLYHYYADVAPAAARMLRWLLMLPGGNKVQGLQEMLRARNAGQLLRDEADYQLHVIYLWYEKRTDRALELLHTLRDRHPRNWHFAQRIAEIQDVYLHDAAASLETWRALQDAATNGSVADPSAAGTRAKLGIALQLDRLRQTDAAVIHLREVIAARPRRPAGALAQAHLQLGHALDRLGDRANATTSFEAAIAAAGSADPLRIGERARAGLRAMRAR